MPERQIERAARPAHLGRGWDDGRPPANRVPQGAAKFRVQNRGAMFQFPRRAHNGALAIGNRRPAQKLHQFRRDLGRKLRANLHQG